MIHVRAMKVNRGNKHGPLHGFYTSSGFGPPNTKEQLRRGVLLCTVASVLVLVGSMLTWLVYTEVFGSKVPIMGPLVMALGILLVILSMRQFYIVWKHNSRDKRDSGPTQEEEEMPYGSMLEMDTWDTGEGVKSPQLHNSEQHPCCNNLQTQQLGHMTDSSAITPSVIPITTTTTTAPSPHTQSAADPFPLPHSPTTLVTPAMTSTDSKVMSCSNLSSMARSSSVEVPNPRPVIRYSQGQLELLDREAASMGRTSPTLLANAPSHQSLGDRSTSSQQHSSHKSLTLSIERTDVLETI